MLNYFPPIKPYNTFLLPVESPHTIYFEESGNPKGIPVLFVHGGPGIGCTEQDRRLFDPSIYRIILFDQRGAGRSTPHAELVHNNIHALLDDMETIRKQLNIKHWILFGVSWGATLSLVYAQTYPQHVIGMILQGTFLNRNQDVEWFCGGKGANFIFPDYWADFQTLIPEDQRHNLLYSYYDLLTSKDELARMHAAKAWATWQAHCSTLNPNNAVMEFFSNPYSALSIARLECHYFVNNCFLEPNQILNNMSSIVDMPGFIIHGRYDMVHPVDNAWELSKAWPKAGVEIIRDAGHSASEPAILDALILATKKMAAMIT